MRLKNVDAIFLNLLLYSSSNSTSKFSFKFYAFKSYPRTKNYIVSVIVEIYFLEKGRNPVSKYLYTLFFLSEETVKCLKKISNRESITQNLLAETNLPERWKSLIEFKVQT